VDRHDWDERYAGDDLVWTATPNRFLAEEVTGLAPGTAVDLACGEGRNAVWLAEEGWRVTGVDFSEVGLDKGRRLAESRGVEVEWVASAVEAYAPPPEGFDLVAVCYLQLPLPQRTTALEIAVRAVAPGGTLVVVAHDRDNLTRGVGGPPDASVLYDVASTAEVATAAGLVVERAGQVTRTVDTDEGPRAAIDTLVRAHRPAAGP
jgi:ubiquinone/menaquinone biosynthesis C-methylase UbiE